MSILTARKKPTDNKYLHRGFHISCDLSLAYVGERYGAEGVAEYIGRFARTYYSPLINDVREHGLLPLKEHLEKIYAAEEASDALCAEISDDTLRVAVAWCPAVRYMKAQGHIPSKWFVETTNTLYQAIADSAGIGFKLLRYVQGDGMAEFRFTSRPGKEEDKRA